MIPRGSEVVIRHERVQPLGIQLVHGGLDRLHR